MANKRTDIELLAGLNIDSSEKEIIKAIKVIEKRLKANHDARFKLNVEIDESVINTTINKLKTILNSKDLKIETKDSIMAITKEANAMLDVAETAKKASSEKLKFAKANKQVKDSANNTSDAINRERNAMDSLDDVDGILQNINRTGQLTNSVFNQMGDVVRDAFGAYTMASFLERGLDKVIDAGKEAIETIKELDDINTDLQFATGEDKSYVKNLISDYNELGQELGALTQDVAKSGDSFLRQGRSMDETNQLIKDSIVLSKIASMDAEESSKILTATINGFQLMADDASKINDVISGIDLESASDASEIGKALGKTAAMAKNAGMSLEKTTAILATMSDITQQSGETIGTTMQAVLSRMGSIAAGKFVDESTGEPLNDVHKVLNKIGVALTDVNGQFRDSEDVIDEVGQKWKTLDKNTQKAVAGAMAGTQHSNRLIAMFDNYEKVISLTETALNSEGQALKKFEDSYLTSLEAKTNALQNSIQNLFSSTISDELYASVLDTSKAIVDVTAETGILKGILSALGTSGAIYAFTQLAGFARNVAQEFNNFGEALTMTQSGQVAEASMQRMISLTGGLTQSQTRLLMSTENLNEEQKISILMNQRQAQGLEELTREQAIHELQLMGVINAQDEANNSSMSFSKTLKGIWNTLTANPLTFLSTGMTAVTTVVSIATTVWENYKEKVFEAAQESASLAQESLNHVTSLKDLKRKLDDGTTSAEELTTAFREQLREMGYTESQIDNLISKYGNLAGAMGEATRKALENAKTDAYADLATSGKALRVASKGNRVATHYSQNKELSKQIRQILDESVAVLDGGVYRLDANASLDDIYSYYVTLKDISRLIQETAMETDDDSLLSGSMLNPTPYYQVAEAIEKLKESAELYGDAMGRIHNADAQIEVSDYLKTNDISTKEDFDSYIQSIKSSTEYSESYRDVLLQVANDAFPQFSQAAKEAKDALDGISNTETPKWSFTETIKEMDAAKQKLTTLDEAYAKLFDADVNTNIGTDDFNSILDAFSEIEGLDIEKHLKSLEDAGGDVDKVKASIESLIGEYLYYGDILNNVTEENKDLVQTMLEEMGVINAVEVVTSALNGYTEAQKLSTIAGIDLVNATAEEINSLTNVQAEFANAGAEAYNYFLNKKLCSENPISTVADCEALIALAKQCQITGEHISLLTKLKNSYAVIEEGSSWGEATKELAREEIERLEAELRTLPVISGGVEIQPSVKPKIEYNPSKNPNSATSKAIDSANKSAADSAKKSTEEMKDAFEELVDFFERRAKVLNDALDLLKANLENVNGSFAKNKLIDAQIGINSEKINNYTDAMAMYTEKANEALSKLPSDIAEKVKNGAVDLTTFVGEGNEDVVEAIDDYQNWADKVAECKLEIAELREELEKSEKIKFDNIAEDFQNMFDIRENSKDLIDKQIALFKEAGQLIGESFYSSQFEQSQKQLLLLQKEKETLVEQMNSALASGRVTVGSEAWLEMINSLTEVDNAIIEAKTSLEEFENSILQLEIEIFNRIQEQFSNFHSELSNMEGLFDDADVSDGNGNWTDEALARLGLLAQQYEISTYQISSYDKQIQKLNQDYLDGKYSVTEYQELLAELTQKQWESVDSANAAKDAIYELNEIRINEHIATINEEIEAYRELIDCQIEELRATQDLYHWNQKMAESTKSITDLERQIAAMSGDNSAATVAKRKQLEAQLAEEKAKLEQEQYDHSVDMQEEALNEQFEAYETERQEEITALEDSLKEKEALIRASFEVVKQNAETVGNQIADKAKEHGIEMSTALTNAWKSGENAIASYGATLNAGASQFIVDIIGVENQTWQLQEQANATAVTLASMFSTKADNLVAQLQASYTNEANLNQMTNALRDSLINTLERGYNIGNVVSNMNSIADAARGVESAANAAANAIRNMGSAKAETPKNETSKPSDGGIGGHGGHGGARRTNAQMVMSKGGIISDKDKSVFDPIAESLGEDTFVAVKSKEAVLTEPQTNMLQKLIKHLENPDREMSLVEMDRARKNGDFMIPISETWDVPMRNDDFKPSSNMNNNINMKYDSLVTINGNVNDTNHFLKGMEKVAERAIEKSWKQLNTQMKHGVIW